MSNQKIDIAGDLQILQAAREVLTRYLADDSTPNFPRLSARLMKAIAEVDYFIAGNRDFLERQKKTSKAKPQ